MDLQLLQAEELGIKLEIVAGLPPWEASPFIRHQLAVDRIRKSIKKLSAPFRATAFMSPVFM